MGRIASHRFRTGMPEPCSTAARAYVKMRRTGGQCFGNDVLTPVLKAYKALCYCEVFCILNALPNSKAERSLPRINASLPLMEEVFVHWHEKRLPPFSFWTLFPEY